MAFMQDQGLDVISEGLDTLKNLAHDMNEVGWLYVFLQFHVIQRHTKLTISDAGIGPASPSY